MHKPTKLIFKICLLMAWCVPPVQAMNFKQKVRNGFAKLRDKFTMQPTEKSSQKALTQDDDFASLVTSQNFNRIHELLKTQQFSGEVLNASYPYTGSKLVTTMPLIASIFCNYGKDDKKDVQWKALVQTLLLQNNIVCSAVVKREPDPFRHEGYSFSLLYTLFFGASVNYVGDSLKDDKEYREFVLKIVSALEVLELLLEYNVKLDPQQGMALIKKGGDGHDDVQWFSIFTCLKANYQIFLDRLGFKDTMDALVECLVDMGVGTDVWHSWSLYLYISAPYTHNTHSIFHGFRTQGTIGIDEGIGLPDAPETRFRDVVRAYLQVKQGKSLGALVQHQRQQPLMNVSFGFC